MRKQLLRYILHSETSYCAKCTAAIHYMFLSLFQLSFNGFRPFGAERLLIMKTKVYSLW